MSEPELKGTVEALLFSSDTPVTLDRLCSVMEGHERSDIREAVERLAAEYDEQGRAFTIAKLAGGWQLYARPEYSKWIRDLNSSRSATRLSQAALETLAIVAYKQPIVRAEVEGVRGVDSSGVLSTLLKRNLIAIAGRAPGMGRALMYRTTREFLRYFGLDSLTDLPRLEEFAEVLGLKPEELEATVEGAESAGALSQPDANEEQDGTGAASSATAPPQKGASGEPAAEQQAEAPRIIARTATEEPSDDSGSARPPFSMHSIPDDELLKSLDED
ncbi:MAG: SMC-Scp complex subunit ScpB [Candidatus Eisenbacteria bacterium]|nr:SMC-Scp complex subunit ScpB [Candidatus Eisenbacteria bacterium]